MPHDPKNNPYSQATGVYGKQKQETPDQRELESHLLLKAASEIQVLYDRWDEATDEDINNILTYNRKLWTVFFDSAVENPDDRPKALRENIISLCNFIFKRTLKILAERDK
jgi:flagellar protein FlaF